MARERVRFGVDVDRELDAEIKKLAQRERRSKRNFHACVLSRIVRLWKENPDQLLALKLIQEA
jgi:hypothetical protein